jgi:hypothetical protein
MIKTLLENVKAFYYLIFLHIETNDQVSLNSLQVIGFHRLGDCNIIKL